MGPKSTAAPAEFFLRRPCILSPPFSCSIRGRGVHRRSDEEMQSEVTLISRPFGAEQGAQMRRRMIAALLSGMLAGLVLGLYFFGVLR